MSKTEGATNKKPTDHPDFLDIPGEERLVFIANLIVDQILEGPEGISELLKTIGIEEALI
jgi:hypothetical protein